MCDKNSVVILSLNREFYLSIDFILRDLREVFCFVFACARFFLRGAWGVLILAGSAGAVVMGVFTSSASESMPKRSSWV